MSCKLESFVNAAKKNGTRLNKEKIDALKKKGSDPTAFELFDTLPKEEQVMSIDKVMMEKLFQSINEDIVSKESEHYDEYLENSGIFISKITEFLKSLPEEQKIRVKTYESNHGTFGMFESGSEDVLSLAIDESTNVSKKSEVLFHELVHAVAKGSFLLSHENRNKIQTIKDIVSSYDHDASIFLTLGSETGENFTEADIADAKEKYDYVLGKHSDLEEFVAYFVSNPSFQYEVNRMVYDYSVENESEKISRFKLKDPAKKKKERRLYDGKKVKPNIVKEVIDTVFNDVITTKGGPIDAIVNSDKNALSMELAQEDGVTKIMNNITDGIIDFRTKVQTSKNPGFLKELVTLRDGSRLKKIIPEIITKPTELAAEIVDNVIDSTIDKVKRNSLYKKVEKQTVKIKKILEDKTISYAKKSGKALKKVKVIDDILKSELFIDLWRQYVSSESNEENAIFYKLSRRAEKIRTTIAAISNEIKKKVDFISQLGVKGSIEANDALMLTYRGELYKSIDYLLSGNLSSKTIKAAFESYENTAEFNEHELERLRNIVDHSLTGKHDLKGDSPYITSVVKDAYRLIDANSKKVEKTDEYKKAEEYMQLYAMTKLSEANIAILNKMARKSKIKQSLIQVAKAFDSRKESLNKTFYLHGSKKILRYGYLDIRPSENKKIFRYVDKKEAKGLLSKGVYNGIVEGEERTILGRKMVLVYSNDTAPAFADGLLKLANDSKVDLSLKNVLFHSEKQNRTDGKTISKVKHENKSYEEVAKIFDTVVSLYQKQGAKEDEIKNIENIIGVKFSELTPVISDSGSITDFEIQMEHTKKNSILERNMSISSIIADTMYSMMDIRASKAHNEKIIDLLYAENESSGIDYPNNDNYIDIMNSKYFNDNILFSKNYTDNIYVKKELIPLIFGSKMASLSNIRVFGYEIGSKTNKLIIEGAEALLSEISSKFKQIVALFTPDVVAGNMASNMYVAKEKGIDLEQFLVEYKHNWKQLNEINDMVDEFNKLQSERLLKPLKTEEITKKMNQLKYDMENHPAYSLYKDGQISPTMEDIDVDESGIIRGKFNKLFYSEKDDAYKELIINKAVELRGDSKEPLSTFIKPAKKAIKKERLHVPILAKNMAKIAYLDSDTVLAKKAKKMLIYSDVITKKIILDKYKADYLKEHGREMPKKVEQRKLDELAELFVSYSTQETGIQKWFENVGMFHFMKYQFRTTKGYLKHMLKNKTRSTVGHIGQILFDIDVPDPLDSNFKHGPIDSLIDYKFRLGDLEEVGEEILTPHLLKLVDF